MNTTKVRIVILSVALMVVALIAVYFLPVLKRLASESSGESGHDAAKAKPTEDGAKKPPASKNGDAARAPGSAVVIAPSGGNGASPPVVVAPAGAGSPAAAVPAGVPPVKEGSVPEGATPGAASGPGAPVLGGPRTIPASASPPDSDVQIPSHGTKSWVARSGAMGDPRAQEPPDIAEPVSMLVMAPPAKQKETASEKARWQLLFSNIGPGKAGTWERALTYFNKVKDNRLSTSGKLAFEDVLSGLVKAGKFEMLAGQVTGEPVADQVNAITQRFLNGPDPDLRFTIDHASREHGLKEPENYSLDEVLSWGPNENRGVRTGNVYSVVSAFLCLMERLNYDTIAPVRLPDRIIVRVRKGRAYRNVDLIRGGAHVSNQQYARDYGLSREERKFFLQDLGPAQFVSELVSRWALLLRDMDPDRAADLLRKARTLDPTNREAGYGLAALLLKPASGRVVTEEDRTEARGLLEIVLGMEEGAPDEERSAPYASLDYPDANLLLGRTLVEAGRDYGRAVKALSRVIRQIGARVSGDYGRDAPFAEDFGYSSAYYWRGLAGASEERKDFDAALADLGVYHRFLGGLIATRGSDPAARRELADMQIRREEVARRIREISLRKGAHQLAGASTEGRVDTRYGKKSRAVNSLRTLLAKREVRSWEESERSAALALIRELGDPNRAYAWEVARNLALVFGREHGIDAGAWRRELESAPR